MINTMAALDEPATGFLGSNRGAPVAPLFERTGGTLQMLDWHLPPRAKRVSPGSSLRGPIRDLGRFYEALRLCLLPPCPGGEKRWIAETTLVEMTSRQRVGRYDDTLGHVVDFGLGFLIDSKQYGVETVPYGYGRFASDSTFGHGGSQSSQGYCDPVHELAIAWLFNGRPGEGQHQRRTRAFNDALYRDLELGR
jgi:CubicO group peptidase (beta-lactamase class C family)